MRLFVPIVRHNHTPILSMPTDSYDYEWNEQYKLKENTSYTLQISSGWDVFKDVDPKTLTYDRTFANHYMMGVLEEDLYALSVDKIKGISVMEVEVEENDALTSDDCLFYYFTKFKTLEYRIFEYPQGPNIKHYHRKMRDQFNYLSSPVKSYEKDDSENGYNKKFNEHGDLIEYNIDVVRHAESYESDITGIPKEINTDIICNCVPFEYRSDVIKCVTTIKYLDGGIGEIIIDGFINDEQCLLIKQYNAKKLIIKVTPIEKYKPIITHTYFDDVLYSINEDDNTLGSKTVTTNIFDKDGKPTKRYVVTTNASNTTEATYIFDEDDEPYMVECDVVKRKGATYSDRCDDGIDNPDIIHNSGIRLYRDNIEYTKYSKVGYTRGTCPEYEVRERFASNGRVESINKSCVEFDSRGYQFKNTVTFYNPKTNETSGVAYHYSTYYDNGNNKGTYLTNDKIFVNETDYLNKDKVDEYKLWDDKGNVIEKYEKNKRLTRYTYKEEDKFISDIKTAKFKTTTKHVTLLHVRFKLTEINNPEEEMVW